jgi:membrane-associated protease RseP (regulator of RpoE activity)
VASLGKQIAEKEVTNMSDRAKSSAWPCVLVVLVLAAAARGDEEPPGTRPEDRKPPEAGGTEDRLWIGIEGFPADETIRTQLEIPKGQGFIVDRVHPESPAERAGLRRHDIILRAGGKEVEAVASFAGLVQESGGKPLELEILRAGKKLVLSLTPGKLATKEPEAWRPLDGWRWQGLNFEGMSEPLFTLDPLTFSYANNLAVLSQGQVPDLPDDVAITVTKKGKEPASIEIRRGAERWKATDREINKLPPDLWKQARSVLRALGSSQSTWYRAPFVQPRVGSGSENMRRDIDGLQKAIDELRAAVRKLEGERASGDGKP